MLCGLACGGPATYPTLTELTLSPAADVPPGSQVKLQARYIDDDGDLAGGQAEVALRRLTDPSGSRFATQIANDAGRRGQIEVTLTLSGGTLAGEYEVALTVIDLAGRRSAPLTTSMSVRTP